MAKTTRRRRWLWLGILPAVVLLAVLGVRSLLQPERLSTFLLRQASQATGLQLALSQPAEVGLWPDLHLELSGLTATAPGASPALLRAERVEAVLPWSALHSDALEIRSLRLVQPQLDWAALQAWLASRAASDAPARIPRIDAAVTVDGGRIAGGDWSLEDVALFVPSLRAGERARVQLSTRVIAAARELPLKARLGFVPREVDGGLAFDDLVIELRDVYELTDSELLDTEGMGLWRFESLGVESVDASSLVLLGSATHGRDGTALALRSTLRWPDTWLALPLPPSDAPLDATLGWKDSRLTLALARSDERIDIDLAPGDIAAWRDDPAAPLLPPLTGAARAERLQFGGVELRGVELRIEDDDAKP